MSAKPLPNSVRFYINGVCYTEEDGYFRVIHDTLTTDRPCYLIEWVMTEYRDGFDLKPSWHYMAVYETDKKNLINLYKIENALNALILINPDLLRTDFTYAKEKEQELIPYIVSQINKGNLTFNQVKALYPDLESQLKQGLVNGEGRNDVMLAALNILLMINPALLKTSFEDLDTIFSDDNIDMLYDYIEQQIRLGIIDDEIFKKRFYNLFPNKKCTY